MQFKATYKGTTKILSGQITNLPTLIESVKKKFPALFENGQFPQIKYFDSEDYVLVDDDDSYQSLIQQFKEEKKAKLFINKEAEPSQNASLYTNSIQESHIDQQKQKIQPQQSKSSKKPIQQSQSLITEQQPKMNSKDSEKKNEPKKKETEPQKEKKVEKKKQKKQKKEETIEEKSKHQIKKQPFKHEKYQCSGCKVEPIIGIRYRCLACFNFDICSQCVKKGFHKQKSHKYAQIQDDAFMKRINFAKSIRLLFNPNYTEPEKFIEQWITEDDILNNNPKVSKLVEEASKDLIQNLIDNFEQIQKQYRDSKKLIK